MAKLLGIDIGTSGCRVILIDESGNVLKQATAEYPVSMPHPMWSEQNPEDWWIGVQKCMAEIGERPDAIGLSGQMHGSVFLDENDQVIRPALLWNDQRTVEETKEIDSALGCERLMEITCNPPLTGFQLPKLLWLRNNEPENFARVRSVLLPKDYIRLMLTGVKATEVSDASGTGALDINRRDWSVELLSALKIPTEWFPPVYESHEISSKTPEGIPVGGGGGDQAAGAAGTGAVVAGIVSVSLGTSGVVFAALDNSAYDKNGATHTFCHSNRKWHAMGVMLSCGGALKWYRNAFSPEGYDRMANAAEKVDPGCDGLTFLPYLTGERSPINDPMARASFSGATLSHGFGHFSRSVYEGASFGLLDSLNLLKGFGTEVNEIRLTGGGARSEFWVQMLADMFQTPCHLLEADEGPAFGAALLAGVGIGLWPDIETACKKTVRLKQRIDPAEVDYTSAFARYKSLYRSLKTWNEEI